MVVKFKRGQLLPKANYEVYLNTIFSFCRFFEESDHVLVFIFIHTIPHSNLHAMSSNNVFSKIFTWNIYKTSL